MSIDQQIESARAQLADLQSKYTNDHPDIRKLKESIANLEALKEKQDKEAKEALGQANASDKDTDADTKPTTSPAQFKAMAPVMQVQSEIKANKIEIQTRDAEIRRLQEKAALYQARLNMSPTVEAEMNQLNRDYDQSKKGYDDLLEKRDASGLATNLEGNNMANSFG